MMVNVDDGSVAALEQVVAESDGIIPVSVESLVNMAVDAFLEGARS